MTGTDEEKRRADELLGRLELAVGQAFAANRTLVGVTQAMLEDLRALRSLLGLVKPH